jgi:two-component system, OmpR family, KDP operon response regulator KdpE
MRTIMLESAHPRDEVDVPQEPEWARKGGGGGPMPLVLVVADDVQKRGFVALLAEQRFRVLEAGTGSEALIWLRANNPDIVLLDLDLLETDGIALTTRFREWTSIPIVIVSLADENRIMGALDAGANDFITKPVGAGELIPRLRAWLRRRQPVHSNSMTVLQVGNFRIDFSKHLAFVGEREVRLTPTQHKLFGVMMRNAGRVLTYEDLLIAVWGSNHTRGTQHLRIYMGKLREKFETVPARPQYFLTEPGLGYRLQPVFL